MLRKNQKQMFTRVLIMATIVALAVIGLWVVHVGADGKGAGSVALRIAPPNSKAFGKTLTEWNTIYWERTLTGGESKVGRVQLMPLPYGEYVGGSGTEDDPLVFAGQLEITLAPGTPFVLPLFAWIGEGYDGYPEVPDDEPFPDDDFIAWIHPNLTIDGKTVMSDDNKAAFYIGPTWFEQPIMYPEPGKFGAVAAIWFQGFGIVSQPLSVGEHVIHLWEPFTLPDYPYYIVYDNTLFVTVVNDD